MKADWVEVWKLMRLRLRWGPGAYLPMDGLQKRGSRNVDGGFANGLHYSRGALLETAEVTRLGVVNGSCAHVYFNIWFLRY